MNYYNNFDFLLCLGEIGEDLQDLAQRVLDLYSSEFYEPLPNTARKFYECLILYLCDGNFVYSENSHLNYSKTLGDYFYKVCHSKYDKQFYSQVIKDSWQLCQAYSHYEGIKNATINDLINSCEQIIISIFDSSIWFYEKIKNITVNVHYSIDDLKLNKPSNSSDNTCDDNKYKKEILRLKEELIKQSSSENSFRTELSRFKRYLTTKEAKILSLRNEIKRLEDINEERLTINKRLEDINAEHLIVIKRQEDMLKNSKNISDKDLETRLNSLIKEQDILYNKYSTELYINNQNKSIIDKLNAVNNRNKSIIDKLNAENEQNKSIIDNLNSEIVQYKELLKAKTYNKSVNEVPQTSSINKDVEKFKLVSQIILESIQFMNNLGCYTTFTTLLRFFKGQHSSQTSLYKDLCNHKYFGGRIRNIPNTYLDGVLNHLISNGYIIKEGYKYTLTSKVLKNV